MYRHYKRAVSEGLISKIETDNKRWRPAGTGKPAFSLFGHAMEAAAAAQQQVQHVQHVQAPKRPREGERLQVRVRQLSPPEPWDGFTIRVQYIDLPPGYEIYCTMPG